jgi:hypothetical protein
VSTLCGASGALTPELWRDGILAASGERIALSIVHCRPGPRWVDALLGADLTQYCGVGGRLMNDPGSDAVGWAIFIMRYLRYALPQQRHETYDIPGDNAVYDRASLLQHRGAFAHGFWEPEVHRLLRAEGRRLLFDPDLRTTYYNGYRVQEFAGQRHRHGVQFGFDRARQMPAPKRWAYLAASPAIPLVFGARIVRGAWRSPDAQPHLLRALPYLGLFLCAWALGEAQGILRALFERGEGAEK